MDSKPIDIFFERHIGFGFRWNISTFQSQYSFSFPFFTVVITITKGAIP